jgi:hypothetical protein
MIRVIVPAGLDVDVVVERALVAPAPRYAPAGSPAALPTPAAPRGAQVTTGRGDGSATDKQRNLLRARCRGAGVQLEDALGWCGLAGIHALGWKDLKDILERLAAPAEVAPVAPALATDDMEGMPF